MTAPSRATPLITDLTPARSGTPRSKAGSLSSAAPIVPTTTTHRSRLRPVSVRQPQLRRRLRARHGLVLHRHASEERRGLRRGRALRHRARRAGRAADAPHADKPARHCGGGRAHRHARPGDVRARWRTATCCRSSSRRGHRELGRQRQSRRRGYRLLGNQPALRGEPRQAGVRRGERGGGGRRPAAIADRRPRDVHHGRHRSGRRRQRQRRLLPQALPALEASFAGTRS